MNDAIQLMIITSVPVLAFERLQLPPQQLPQLVQFFSPYFLALPSIRQIDGTIPAEHLLPATNLSHGGCREVTNPGGIPEIDPAHTSLQDLAGDNSELSPGSYPVD